LRILHYMSIRLEQVHNENFQEPEEKIKALSKLCMKYTNLIPLFLLICSIFNQVKP
jgi:hypothetical protein